MSLERDEFLGAIDSVKELLNQRCNFIDANISKINGRVGRAEDRISELEGDVKVLEDRGTRDGAARTTSIGSAIASGAALLYQWFGK